MPALWAGDVTERRVLDAGCGAGALAAAFLSRREMIEMSSSTSPA